MVADTNEISNNLIDITPNNSYIRWNETKDKILVCSFFNGNYSNSYPIDTDVKINWGEMWVTVIPE